MVYTELSNQLLKQNLSPKEYLEDLKEEQKWLKYFKFATLALYVNYDLVLITFLMFICIFNNTLITIGYFMFTCILIYTAFDFFATRKSRD